MQMESITKRMRSTNWTEQEKTVLRKLVLERANILENKNTSTNANTAKKAAWEDVLSCYNAVNTSKRDLCQLINQWRNMKNRAKKSEFIHRRSRNMTGGGPPPPSPPLEHQQLIEALPNEFKVDNNTYDSDSIYIITQPEGNEGKEAISTSNFLGEQSNIEMPVANVEENTVDFKNVREERTKGPSASTSTYLEKKKGKKKFISNCCRNENEHEHQLFLLAKAARVESMQYAREAHERKMDYEKEEHRKRMAIMSLEEEYLRLKIKKM